MRMPLFEKATQTLPAAVSTRSYESTQALLTSSRQECAGATASDFTACTSVSTSEVDSLQLRQVFRCCSTAVCSIGASSRVRRASMRVSAALHCICDSLLFQRVPEQLERPEHFPPQRGLGRADGLGDLRVRHLFHEAEDDELARVDRQQRHSALEQLDLFLPLQLRTFEVDERPEPAVVERLQRLLEGAALR